jgi:hypothetical protein
MPVRRPVRTRGGKSRLKMPVVYFGEVNQGVKCKVTKEGIDTLLLESGLQKATDSEMFVPKGYNINKMRMIYYRKDFSQCWKRPSPH